MPALLRKLLCLPEPKGRVVLTPGRLYFLMSQELRAARRGRKCGCSMPMIYALPADGTRANWDVEPFTFQCEACRDVALGVLGTHRRRYDANHLELPPANPKRLSTKAEEPVFENGVRLFGQPASAGNRPLSKRLT